MTAELAPLQFRAKELNVELEDEDLSIADAEKILDRLDNLYDRISKIRNAFVNSQ